MKVTRMWLHVPGCFPGSSRGKWVSEAKGKCVMLLPAVCCDNLVTQISSGACLVTIRLSWGTKERPLCAASPFQLCLCAGLCGLPLIRINAHWEAHRQCRAGIPSLLLHSPAGTVGSPREYRLCSCSSTMEQLLKLFK